MEANNKNALIAQIEGGQPLTPDQMAAFLNRAGSKREVLVMGMAIGLNAKTTMSAGAQKGA